MRDDLAVLVLAVQRGRWLSDPSYYQLVLRVFGRWVGVLSVGRGAEVDAQLGEVITTCEKIRYVVEHGEQARAS